MKFVIIEVGSRFIKSKHYARIHRASCGFAKEPKHETASTVWHGYFDTFFEALSFAKSLGTESIYECKFCDPRHG